MKYFPSEKASLPLPFPLTAGGLTAMFVSPLDILKVRQSERKGDTHSGIELKPPSNDARVSRLS